MTDTEYNKLKEQATEILSLARSFNAWKFKHEAKLRGERTLGQWMWTIHLEAMEAP